MSDWSVRSFGEFCRQHKVLNASGDDLTPLSVTKSDGVVAQATKFKKRIAISDTTKYKILERGEFAYDPMSLYYGAIGRLESVRQGIVSPAYITFNVDPSISPEYFWYLVKSEWVQQEFVARTVGGNLHGKRKKTDWDAFCSVSVPLPPLVEQKKIAAVLSSVDEAIHATEGLIAQTRRVKSGLLHDLLTRGIGHTQFKETEIGEIPATWELLSIENLLADIPNPMRSGPFGSALLKDELVSDGIPLLGIDNVHRECFVGDYKRFVTPEKYRELSRYMVRPGDVMITIMGTVGRSCVVPEQIGPALSSKHVWTISLDPFRYRSDLACMQLNYARWVLKHFDHASQGGVMDAISSSTLRTTLLPCPPLEEQNDIARLLNQVQQDILTQEATLDGLSKVKRGLVQDLLTGRVRVPATA